MNQLTKVGKKSLPSIPEKLSIADCIDQKPLAIIGKEIPILEVAQAIKSELRKLVVLYGWNVSDEWYKLFFQVIMDSYPAESLNDVIIVLRNGAKGKYKKPFGILDPVTFKEWMSVHLEEKYQKKEQLLNEVKADLESGERVNVLGVLYERFNGRMDLFTPKEKQDLDPDKLHKMRKEAHKKNKVGHDIPKDILEEKKRP